MIRKKLRNAVLILAGACMLAGTVTSYAAVPEDLWKYDMSTSQDGTITYQFKEVSISLPPAGQANAACPSGTAPSPFTTWRPGRLI